MNGKFLLVGAIVVLILLLLPGLFPFVLFAALVLAAVRMLAPCHWDHWKITIEDWLFDLFVYKVCLWFQDMGRHLHESRHECTCPATHHNEACKICVQNPFK